MEIVLSREVNQLEDEITILSIQIEQYERELTKIENESNEFLRIWSQTPLDPDPEKQRRIRHERKSIIDKINKNEKNIEELYITSISEREKRIQQLRSKYVEEIKKWTKNPTAQTQKIDSSILSSSSILSGTSMGMMNLDPGKMFKSWEITSDFGKAKQIGKSPRIKIYEDVIQAKTILIKEYHISFTDNKKSEDISKLYSAMKGIGHKNLVSPLGRLVSDKKSPKENLRIMLEKVESPTGPSSLLEFYSKKISIPFTLKVKIAEQICSAMAWLHKMKQIPHSRLKPGNVLFNKDYAVKVSDYGLGLPRYYDAPEKHKKHWVLSHQLHFTAPEVISGQNSTLESDIWSFGLILVVLFSKKYPFYVEEQQESGLIVIQPSQDYDTIVNNILAFVDILKNHKTYESVYQNLQEKKLFISLPSPEETTSTLQSLILDCLNPDPKQRIFFETIGKENLFQKIISEATTRGSKEIQEIVDRALRSSNKGNFILWSKLKEDLLPKKSNPGLESAVLNYLGIKNISNPEMIGIDKDTLSQLLSVVHPFQKNDFASFCSNLIEKAWFYGIAERNDIDNILNDAMFRLSKTKPVVVRQSKGSNYQFTICFAEDKAKITHKIIKTVEYSNIGIIEFITNEIQQKKI